MCMYMISLKDAPNEAKKEFLVRLGIKSNHFLLIQNWKKKNYKNYWIIQFNYLTRYYIS